MYISSLRSGRDGVEKLVAKCHKAITNGIFNEPKLNGNAMGRLGDHSLQ